MVFRAAGSENERSLGPNRTTSPCLACNFICSTSGLRLYTIQNLHQSVIDARNGPGYLFRPRVYLFLMRYETNKIARSAGQLRATPSKVSASMMSIDVKAEGK